MFGINDVSGPSCTHVLRCSVVVILTHFYFKISGDVWDRIRDVLRIVEPTAETLCVSSIFQTMNKARHNAGITKKTFSQLFRESLLELFLHLRLVHLLMCSVCRLTLLLPTAELTWRRIFKS
jgi:hypothetical protein